MKPAALPPRLLRRFDALAGRSPLLLAMDFDGTLAPIVPTASRARMPARVARLLRALARTRGVKVALISGRSLQDLRRRCPLRGAYLVGIHGLSSTVKGVGLPAVEARRWRGTLRQARQALQSLALRRHGIRIENKGLGLALHLGRAPRRHWAKRVTAALTGLAVELQLGLRVLELRPPGHHGKGLALRSLADACVPGWRRRGACLFAGDDATDEDAFKALKKMGPRALGLKIGPGRSAAQGRVKGPQQFWALLERILRIRLSLSGRADHVSLRADR
jgi:trehalose-phosphatase